LNASTEKKLVDLELSFKIQQTSLEAKITDIAVERDRYKKDAQDWQAALMRDADAKVQAAVAKFQDLPKEVESLKVVVQMRSEEVHHLRMQNAELQRQVEDIPSLRQKIRTLEAKNEDLKEVLRVKIEAEKNIGSEHRRLVESFERESYENKRLSMQNEQLQWKLQETMSQSFPSPSMLDRSTGAGSSSAREDDMPTHAYNPQTMSCYAALPSSSPLKAYAQQNSPSVRRNTKDASVTIFTANRTMIDGSDSYDTDPNEMTSSGVVLRNPRRRTSSEGPDGGESSMPPIGNGATPTTTKAPRAKSVDKLASPKRRTPIRMTNGTAAKTVAPSNGGDLCDVPEDGEPRRSGGPRCVTDSGIFTSSLSEAEPDAGAGDSELSDQDAICGGGK